jgi:hypothetical protein
VTATATRAARALARPRVRAPRGADLLALIGAQGTEIKELRREGARLRREVAKRIDPAVAIVHGGHLQRLFGHSKRNKSTARWIKLYELAGGRVVVVGGLRCVELAAFLGWLVIRQKHIRQAKALPPRPAPHANGAAA